MDKFHTIINDQRKMQTEEEMPQPFDLFSEAISIVKTYQFLMEVEQKFHEAFKTKPSAKLVDSAIRMMNTEAAIALQNQMAAESDAA